MAWEQGYNSTMMGDIVCATEATHISSIYYDPLTFYCDIYMICTYMKVLCGRIDSE